MTTTHSRDLRSSSKKQQQATQGDHLEVSQLKQKFKSQLHTLRQLFSESWNDEDLIAVLQEVNGDLDVAIGRISEGHAEQWATAASKKNKPKKSAQASTTPARSGRGGRGAGSSRGGGRVGRGGRQQSFQSSIRDAEPQQQQFKRGQEDATSTAATIGSSVTEQGNGWGNTSAPKSNSWNSSVDAARKSDEGWSSNSGAVANSQAVQEKSSSWSAQTGSKPEEKDAGWLSDAAVVSNNTPGWSDTKPSENVSKQSWGNSNQTSAVPPKGAVLNKHPAEQMKASTTSSWGAEPVQSQQAAQPWSQDNVNPGVNAGWSKLNAVESKNDGWGQGPVAAPVVSEQVKPKVTSASSSKSTWAQIAKPELPVSEVLPVPATRQRSQSPKRAASVAPAQEVANKIAHVDRVTPPGIGQHQSLGVASQQLISGASPIAVKFGSLGFGDDHIASDTPVAEVQQHAQSRQAYALPQQSQQAPDQYAQYQTQPPQVYGVNPEFQSSLYGAGSLGGVVHGNANGAYPQQAQLHPGQQQQYSMSPANLANMYAHYFPYYMQQQQFQGQGANPQVYGGAGVVPTQGFSPQQQHTQLPQPSAPVFKTQSPYSQPHQLPTQHNANVYVPPHAQHNVATDKNGAFARNYNDSQQQHWGNQYGASQPQQRRPPKQQQQQWSSQQNSGGGKNYFEKQQ